MVESPKILTVIGTRPQFIKAGPVSRGLRRVGLHEVVVETGQHYDNNMRRIFFEQLALNEPQYCLEIGSGSHGYQTSEGLKRLEPIIEAEKPDAVLVYGDTNAALTGALTAAKMHIPVAHVEAGLRSFNRRMPEEINRVMIDHLSTWLFAPTQKAVDNLLREGMTTGVHQTGDVMLDTTLFYREQARQHCGDWLARLGLTSGEYFLLTMHRADTAKTPEMVASLLTFLNEYGVSVLFPVHPRMQSLVSSLGPFQKLRCVEPLGYFEMLTAIQSAQAVITDSGGLQKEAAFLEVPCLTLREETEWTETIESGWNHLVALSKDSLQEELERLCSPNASIHQAFGDGDAAHHIAGILSEALARASVPV